MPPVVRTLLFWLMMIALAAVLWKMASKGPEPASNQAMSYSDFLNCVHQNNIASVKLVESQSTAEIQGQLRRPVQEFTVTIPKEAIPDLTRRLQEQGTAVDVVERKSSGPRGLIVNFVPIALIIGVWIYLMKRRQGSRNRSPSSGPGNGALG
jgi:cell division protease FtsH